MNSEEEVVRDEDRVEEYKQLYTGVTLKAPRTVELRTGIIPAARFADKIRRVALAAFKGYAPRDVIIRDVSEFNQQLYELIVKKMGCGKGDLIRINIDVVYDEEKQRLVFGEPKIDKLVPESDIRAYYEDRIKKLKDENTKLLEELELTRRKLNALKAKLEELTKEL
ncbi:MAG: DUF2258 domain-containing protein [Thermofilaceae archaeon]|nr:DUF2258 domain-containing protein [Thermofilaceae archaeon]MCX8180723.1 DUF2258 domain-containing protein [Thermofilaceae archaeon]MDW8003941.1 DUF2258 domain-containing protein [Thermofilaceae archaeon]